MSQTSSKKIKNLLVFFRHAEKLKTLLRHSWLSSGRRESVAEHTWRMASMAMIFAPLLKRKVNLEKVLRMVVIHDLGEIGAGDVWAFKKTDRKKRKKLEEKCVKTLAGKLLKKQSSELLRLWRETENFGSLEGRFVKALDRLEVLIQHHEAGVKFLNKEEYSLNLSYGVKECEIDPLLRLLREQINQDFVKQYKKARIPKKYYLENLQL